MRIEPLIYELRVPLIETLCYQEIHISFRTIPL